MSAHEAYSPELIAWVRRTTTAQGVPEHLDPATFAHRLGALFEAGSRPDGAGRSAWRRIDQPLDFSPDSGVLSRLR